MSHKPSYRICYYMERGIPTVVEIEHTTESRALRQFNELMDAKEPLIGELVYDHHGPDSKLVKVFIGENCV